MKYELEFTRKAERMLIKYIKGNPLLEKKFLTAFETLLNDQFSPSLRTHKVVSKDFGMAFSSRVTGDIRVIWNYYEDQVIILIYTIGSHSGKRSVY